MYISNRKLMKDGKKYGLLLYKLENSWLRMEEIVTIIRRTRYNSLFLFSFVRTT